MGRADEVKLCGGGRIRWTEVEPRGAASAGAGAATPAGVARHPLAAPPAQALMVPGVLRARAIQRLGAIWLTADPGRVVHLAAPVEDRARLASVLEILDGADPDAVLRGSGLGRRERRTWAEMLREAAAMDPAAFESERALGLARGAPEDSARGILRSIAASLLGLAVMAFGIVLIGPYSFALAQVAAGASVEPAEAVIAAVPMIGAWIAASGEALGLVEVLAMLSGLAVGFAIVQSVEDRRHATPAVRAVTRLSYLVEAGVATAAMLIAAAVALAAVAEGGMGFDRFVILPVSLGIAAVASGLIHVLGLTQHESVRRARRAGRRLPGLRAQLISARTTSGSFAGSCLAIAVVAGLLILVSRWLPPAIGAMMALGVLSAGWAPFAAPTPWRPSRAAHDWLGTVAFGFLAWIACAMALLQAAAFWWPTIDDPAAIVVIAGSALLPAGPIIGLIVWLVHRDQAGKPPHSPSAKRAAAREIRGAIRTLVAGASEQARRGEAPAGARAEFPVSERRASDAGRSPGRLRQMCDVLNADRRGWRP